MTRKVLLYYKFIEVTNPEKEVSEHKKVCSELGLKGRILIASEGINGTVEGPEDKLIAYKSYLNNHSLFSGIEFKETESKERVFKKLKIKAREEVVTLNKRVNLKKTGKRLSREELHKALEEGEDLVLIDMRNEYESKIGKFKDAVVVKTQNFRDLPEEIESLEKFKNKKIVTYCTGGIRCEKASALLVEEGFQDVYQLEGGIFKYAEKYPDGFFEGKCFVFDSRMSVTFNKNEPAKVLATCEHCKEAADDYYDCTNLTCHRLFIACQQCSEKFQGLCKNELKSSETLTSPQIFLN